jgi:hypothetical protein
MTTKIEDLAEDSRRCFACDSGNLTIKEVTFDPCLQHDTSAKSVHVTCDDCDCSWFSNETLVAE